MKLSNHLKSTLRVAKIELNSMFYSPVAWLVIFIFVCQIGYSFFEIFDKQLHSHDQERALWSLTTYIFTGMQGILTPILRNLYLFIPLITMGLMSREYQSGSIKLLYSSPIRTSSIILGKFTSMVVYGVALLGILVFIMIFCSIAIHDFDYPILLSSLLGFFLLILAYSAIGIFMSSLTHYQVVAAIGTLALLAGLNFVGKVGQEIDFVRDITYWLGISNRSYPFIDGLISSEDVLYYIIVIIFFLSLAIFKLNTEKTIMSRGKKIMGYSSIVLGAVAAGYITSRPQVKFYCDVTQDQQNTLSEESQKIVAEVKKEKGNLKIITYTNILAEDYHSGLAKNRIMDKSRFEKYLRFMPGLEMEYVLYYDKTTNPSYTAQRYQQETMEKSLEMVCKSDNIDPTTVLTPEEFKAKYGDFSKEGNKFIRVVETPSGEKGYLRMFNDNDRHPSEAEISAVLSRFISKSPMVGFYTNNEPRAIDNYGDRGFYLFAHDKWFRSSLLNQGFETKKVELKSGDLDSIDVLVIADLKDSLSEEALMAVQEYVAKGGNLFLTGEYRRSENMNKIAEMLGIEFSDGVLVEESKYHNPTIIAAQFTKEGADKYPTYTKLWKYDYVVSANSAVAIDYSKSAEKGFRVTPVLKTSPEAWLEMETTDFVDGTFVCNPEAGESRAVRTLLLTMEREVNGKSQRIVVSGDSDMIGNGELTAKHPNMNAQNYSIIKGSFRWLSNDVYPVDVSKIDKTDNVIDLPKGSRKYVKALYLYLIPLTLLIFGIVTIVKRQRK